MQTNSDSRPLHISKKKWRIISAAVECWLDAGIISTEEAQRLRNSYAGARPISWKIVARYSFIMASFCVFLSVVILLTDEWIIALFEELFNAPALVKSIGFAIISGGLFWKGTRVRIRSPDKIYSIRTTFLWSVGATAFSIKYLGVALIEELDYFDPDLLVSALLMLAAIIYGVLGLWLRANIIWLFSLLSLGSWFGFETSRVSSVEGYWLGMNYPLRFVLFWAVITLCGSYLFSRWKNKSEFLRPTMAVGLLFFFLALYATSLCGNYPVDECYELTPIQVFHWWVILAGASVAAIFHGVKYNDDITKGLGLAFIFINLYTRFFECFWGPMHKAVFFAILGVSFWYIGSKAEKIWRLSMVGDWLSRSTSKP